MTIVKKYICITRSAALSLHRCRAKGMIQWTHDQSIRSSKFSLQGLRALIPFNFLSIDAVDVTRLRRCDGFAVGTIACQSGSVTPLVTNDFNLLWLRVSVSLFEPVEATFFERSAEVLWDDGFVRTTVHDDI